MLDVSLLGTGGMMPLHNRFLTSMICRLGGKMLVVDCGEGTQVTLRQLKYGFKKIDVICITHFHADHIAGLPGLLLSIGNSAREENVTLIGPKGLKEVVSSLLVICSELPFDINYIEIEDTTESIELSGFTIETKFVEHRVECLSYKITARRPGLFSKTKAIKNKVPMEIWNKLRREGNVIENGKEYTLDMILENERKGITVCYSTDTVPMKDMPDFINECDLFICEGLYADEHKREQAHNYGHMTIKDACNIAKEGNVKRLWLTHFSPSVKEPMDYEDYAKEIFDKAEIGFDRKEIKLLYDGKVEEIIKEVE